MPSAPKRALVDRIDQLGVLDARPQRRINVRDAAQHVERDAHRRVADRMDLADDAARGGPQQQLAQLVSVSHDHSRWTAGRRVASAASS